jgi:hypothetical protein
MAEFYAWVRPDTLQAPAGWSPETKPPAIPDEGMPRRQLQADLPGVGSLDDRSKGKLFINQVTTGVHSLGDLFQSAGLSAPAIPDLSTLVRWSGPDGRHSLAHALLNLHVGLMSTLEAADHRVGKAYGLGRALADLTLRPKQSDGLAFSKDFQAQRVVALSQDLQDLKSALPPHAGQAVVESIATWQRWSATPTWKNRPLDWPSDKESVLHALSTQGTQWRLLLTGEKAPLDQLRAEDYVDAAGFLLGRLRQLASKYISQYWPYLAAFSILVVIGIILALTLLASPAAKAAGVAVSVLGGLGLTSASAISTLKKGAASAEDYLWQAELDLAVGRATTTLPRHASPPLIGEPTTIGSRRLANILHKVDGPGSGRSP